jgi:hypothetical protein
MKKQSKKHYFIIHIVPVGMVNVYESKYPFQGVGVYKIGE